MILPHDQMTFPGLPSWRWFLFRRLTKTKTLPPRPPPAKTGPGRPPPPSLQATGRAQSWNAPQKQKPPRKCPVLPPRPNPGHRLYNKYTVRHVQRVPVETVVTFSILISLFFMRACFFFFVVAPASTSSWDRCHWPQWQQYWRAVIPGIQTSFTPQLCSFNSDITFGPFSIEKRCSPAAGGGWPQHVWVSGGS